MNPKKWLDIETVGIASVLRRNLRLPLSQREYSWTDVHVDDLFSDLNDAIADSPTYFLGTIVITQDDSPILFLSWTDSNDLQRQQSFLRHCETSIC